MVFPHPLQIPPNVPYRLEHALVVADLAKSPEYLREKVVKAIDHCYPEVVCKVKGSDRQWIVGTYDDVSDLEKSYLIYPRKGRVKVFSFKESWSRGEFKYVNNLLLGAVGSGYWNLSVPGAIAYRHSGDSWKCVSFISDNNYGGDAHFCSNSSYDVRGDVMMDGFRSLLMRRGAPGVMTWRWFNGRYHPAKPHLVHDELFAFDDLVYACEKRNTARQIWRCPNKRWRQILNLQLRRARGSASGDLLDFDERYVNGRFLKEYSLEFKEKDGQVVRHFSTFFKFGLIGGHWQVVSCKRAWNR